MSIDFVGINRNYLSNNVHCCWWHSDVWRHFYGVNKFMVHFKNNLYDCFKAVVNYFLLLGCASTGANTTLYMFSINDNNLLCLNWLAYIYISFNAYPAKMYICWHIISPCIQAPKPIMLTRLPTQFLHIMTKTFNLYHKDIQPISTWQTSMKA